MGGCIHTDLKHCTYAKPAGFEPRSALASTGKKSLEQDDNRDAEQRAQAKSTIRSAPHASKQKTPTCHGPCTSKERHCQMKMTSDPTHKA